MKNNRYSDDRGFTDLLFNLVLGFSYLFLIAFLLINPIKEDSIIEPRALMKLIVTWPDSDVNDVDTWIKCDSLGIVSFRDKDNGILHLDRDDQGETNDKVVINGQEVVSNLNYEIINFRQKYPCRYFVNMHLYSRKDELNKPIPIKIKLYDLTPYKKLAESTVVLRQEGSEVASLQFTIDSEGNIINITKDDGVNWVNKSVIQANQDAVTNSTTPDP